MADVLAYTWSWRGCVETIVSLQVISCAGAKLDQFAKVGQFGGMLVETGVDQKVRESSSVGKDQMFVMRWTWP